MLDFFIVFLCLVINAFFSAYEMAFVTVSKEEISDMEENGRSAVSKIIQFKKKPERTLSVIQIGITLVGAIAAAVGGTGAVESLEPWFVEQYGLSRSMAEAISVAVVIIPLTYFSVVFGELFPKTIALKHPTRILSFGTSILSFIDRVLSPIVTFLEISTNFLLKMVGLSSAADVEDESMGETIDIGNLPAYHQRFVQNLVGLKGARVNKSMIPWHKVVLLNFADSEEDIREKLASTPHSRFPVIDGDVLVGILYAKELPDLQRQKHIPWTGVLRPAVTVNGNEKVLDAFLKMQEKHNHISVVVEGEKFLGIITIEDILEEVVGDIHDTTDQSRISKMLSQRSKINLKG